VDSLRRTIAAVLARELSPHLKPSSVLIPTPTIVPKITTSISTSPVVTISTSVSTQVTPILTSPLNQAPMNTTARSVEATVATVSVSTNSSTTPIIVDAPTSAQSASPQPPEVVNETVIPIGRDLTNDTSGQQLMSLPDLTKMFNKSCSRRNMAANLVRALVDEETRKQSNVSGRGKDMLDPVVISYVKNMCFQFFPLSGADKRQMNGLNALFRLTKALED